MKKIIFVFILFPVLIGCNQKKIKQLETMNDSLALMNYEREVSVNEFLMAINDIQSNLDSIKSKEMIISNYTADGKELKKNVKDQVNDDINAIYSLLLDARSKLDDARKRIGRSDYQVKEFEKMLSNMTSQLEEKDKSIIELREELEKMNIKITDLTQDVSRLSIESEEKSAVIDDQSKTIEQKTLEMHTAYFIVGNSKDLRDKNIITKEGGFIGIGQSKQLKPDFNADHFTRIDIRKKTTIEIPGRKVEIVSTHPSESYSVSGEGDARILTISDYNEFWKSSRYLVVVVQ